MTVDKELIKTLPFFADADEKMLDAVSAQSSIKHLPAGMQLAYEGMSSEHFFIVLSGEIRVYKTSISGKEVTLFNVQEGESCILTIFSIINQAHYPAFASAQTDIQALMIPAETFRLWVTESVSIRDHIFYTLSGRLNNILDTFDQVIFQRMDKRIAQFILAKCPQRGDTLHLTHEKFSHELGTNRVVISRILEAFKEEGLVGLARGCITVLNSDGLSAK